VDVGRHLIRIIQSPDADEFDAIGLDPGVERERRARLTLTPATVAAVREQGPRDHAIPDRAAISAAFD
jgi:hypothetical protein